jgi:hypothetical protein
VKRSADIPPEAKKTDAGSNRRVGRAIIHLFACFHLVAVASWVLTSPTSTAPLNRMVRTRLGPYMEPTALRQQWTMFAPNPLMENVRLEAEVSFRDGASTTWRFPRVDQMGYLERYRAERHRKWASERLAAGKPPAPVLDAAARYVARQVERPGNPPRKVELVRYMARIPSPNRTFYKRSELPLAWERQVCYACELDADGRIVSRWQEDEAVATRPAVTRPADLVEPGATP